ncbi:unnamed protein product [Sympodiomycopsis kandeliae]
MAGYGHHSTFSASSSSSQQPFSAADAYAQYDQGQQTTTPAQQQQQQSNRYSTYSNNDPRSQSPAQSRSRTQSQLSMSRRDVERASRTSGTQRRADNRRSQRYEDDEQEEEESSDEDWNVYDDFNNNNSNNNNANNGQMVNTATPSVYGASDAGYYGKYSTDGLSTPGLTPFAEHPQTNVTRAGGAGNRGSTLLTADAFGFDVQNVDPRHPDVIAQAQRNADLSAAGIPLHDADSHILPGHDPDKNQSGIELITVPALGQEFSKEEMSQMRRPYKRKVKNARRRDKAKRWGKGDYKICGWLNPRFAVLIAFIFIVILAILLYFVIPRVPTLAFLNTDPLEAFPNSASMSTHLSPANFSMTMNLNLRGDNRGGWIPTRASSMKVEVKELTTHKKIGEGKLGDTVFPGRSKKIFKLPVHFSYSSLNATGDATWHLVHDACAHKYPNTPRPNMLLGVELSMNIAGLIGTKTSSTNINAPCPFELQNEQ